MKLILSLSRVASWNFIDFTPMTCTQIRANTITGKPINYVQVKTAANNAKKLITVMSIPAASAANSLNEDRLQLIVGSNGPSCSASFAVQARIGNVVLVQSPLTSTSQCAKTSGTGAIYPSRRLIRHHQSIHKQRCLHSDSDPYSPLKQLQLSRTSQV